MQGKIPTPPESKIRTYLKMLKGYGLIALGILVFFRGTAFLQVERQG